MSRRSLFRFLGWCLAFIVLMWRLTCRYRVVNDVRPSLRAKGQPYVYALLHAHQIGAALLNDEKRMCAMVSRSKGGELLAPGLRLRHVTPVRGSTRRGTAEKGGRAALQVLQEHVMKNIPALLAVDGPLGPRGKVHRGIVDLCCATGAVILPASIHVSRSLVLRNTWDHLQIPMPFSTIELRLGAPIAVTSASEDSVKHIRLQLAETLAALESTPA